ncbi:cupin-2 domain-containing protein [Favolaschia claudopus]|uniref:Cupin-2 domain-containing protein n=1 Tax=Favolaschia claudopus TaxID=2862362 RepID=A0AAW0AFG0_9AGAR
MLGIFVELPALAGKKKAAASTRPFPLKCRPVPSNQSAASSPGTRQRGKGTVVADTVQPPTFWSPQSISPVYDLCHTSESPAVIDSEIREGNMNGSVFRVFEFSPGTVSPAHRTGSIVLELDDGERITLNEGDTIVQRGTMHTWRNESKTEWARIYFIVLGAKPVEINGQELKEEWRQ